MIIRVIKKIFIVLLVLIIVLVGLLITLLIFKSNPSVYTSKNGDIVYTGKINAEGYEKILNKYKNAIPDNKPKNIIIKSGGGSGLVGVLIGRFIHKHDINIKVRDYCMSTCANFIFPAAKEKTLIDNALLVFHGGFFQENLFEKIKSLYQSGKKDQNKNNEASVTKMTPEESNLFKYHFPELKPCFEKSRKTDNGIANCITPMRSIEKEFYTALEVDPNLPYLGQRGIHEETYKSYEYFGFYYSIKSLKELGLKNIVTTEDWDPSSHRYFSKVYIVDTLN